MKTFGSRVCVTALQAAYADRIRIFDADNPAHQITFQVINVSRQLNAGELADLRARSYYSP